VRDKKHSNEILIGHILLKETLCCHESIKSYVISIKTIPQLIEILDHF